MPAISSWRRRTVVTIGAARATSRSSWKIASQERRIGSPSTKPVRTRLARTRALVIGDGPTIGNSHVAVDLVIMP